MTTREQIITAYFQAYAVSDSVIASHFDTAEQMAALIKDKEPQTTAETPCFDGLLTSEESRLEQDSYKLFSILLLMAYHGERATYRKLRNVFDGDFLYFKQIAKRLEACGYIKIVIDLEGFREIVPVRNPENGFYFCVGMEEEAEEPKTSLEELAEKTKLQDAAEVAGVKVTKTSKSTPEPEPQRVRVTDPVPVPETYQEGGKPPAGRSALTQKNLPPEPTKKASKKQRQILDLIINTLQENGLPTQVEIAAKMRCESRELNYHINTLEDAGYISVSKIGRNKTLTPLYTSEGKLYTPKTGQQDSVNPSHTQLDAGS